MSLELWMDFLKERKGAKPYMKRWKIRKGLNVYLSEDSVKPIPKDMNAMDFYFDVLESFKFIEGSVYTKEQVLLEREYGNLDGKRQ